MPVKSLFSSESSPLGTGDGFSSLAASLHVDLSLSLACTGVSLPVSSYFLLRIVPHMEVCLLCLMQQVGSTSSNSAILTSSSRSVVLEKTLESPLDCKEIQPVHLKGN